LILFCMGWWMKNLQTLLFSHNPSFLVSSSACWGDA
jgi:hypothetical protein